MERWPELADNCFGHAPVAPDVEGRGDDFGRACRSGGPDLRLAAPLRRRHCRSPASAHPGAKVSASESPTTRPATAPRDR